MKSIMIIFNQANTERVEYMLDMLEIRGFTFFEEVQGRGSKNGEPRRGTHAWPEMNSCVITIVPVIYGAMSKKGERDKLKKVRENFIFMDIKVEDCEEK